MASDGTRATQVGSSSCKTSKEKDRYIGWDYGIPIPGNRDHVQCSFCDTIYKGGITRLKYHLIGQNKNVAACKKCPQHVKERLEENWKLKLDEKQAPKQVKQVDAFIFDDVEVVSRRCDPGPKGPMDIYYRQGGGKKFKSVKEQNEYDKCRKEIWDYDVHMFSRWMYDAGIASNAMNYDYFQDAIDAIGQYGPGMKAPTYHEVRTKFLNKEQECIENDVEEHMNEAKKNGCTLMVDGWTDRNGRTLINFLVNTPRGSIFVDSVDASSYSKTGEKMFELFGNFIDRTNASENVLTGKLLETKYLHLFWTPCVAHSLDLIFEDIFKIPRLKRTIERAIKVSGYIYSRTKLLSMIRKYTGGK